jgi:hypothetical protein
MKQFSFPLCSHREHIRTQLVNPSREPALLLNLLAVPKTILRRAFVRNVKPSRSRQDACASPASPPGARGRDRASAAAQAVSMGALSGLRPEGTADRPNSRSCDPRRIGFAVKADSWLRVDRALTQQWHWPSQA